ncbi:MAG: transposase [Verrucomicrobiales bacterium]|nr:transposase [Verrucomicrobiales bacterium]
MATYSQILYHLVFSTKNRRPVLDAGSRDDLFRYVWGFLKNKECHLYRINGVEDHVHILTSLHPTVALSDLIHDLKLATSTWVKSEKIFPAFEKWQEGYGAFTISWPDRDGIIEYIKNQVEHHKSVSFREEYIQLLQKFDVKYEEKYLD